MAKTLCPLLLLVNYAKDANFFTWEICLLSLFAKIKFSQKFMNLQYYGNHFTENNRDWTIDSDFVSCMLQRHVGSYMSAHVLLILNELGKKDKMRGLPSILSPFSQRV